MQFTLRKTGNTLDRDLAAKLRTSRNPRKVLEAMGLQAVSLAKRSFNDPSLRPSTWANKSDGTRATLKKSGELFRTVRVTSVNGSTVTVGSARKYAAIHQLGGKTPPHKITAKNGGALKIPGIGFRKSVNHPGSKIPARPFLPFDKSGKPTASASRKIVAIARQALDKEFGAS